MKNQKFAAPAALLAMAGLACSALATNTTETEPNDNKAGANAVVGMVSGDTITGNTTGTSTTVAGAASSDNFRIKTAPAALGIYRHNLSISTAGTAGHAGTIRGLNQIAATAGVWDGVTIGTVGTTDTALQTSSTATTPARSNVWYGFGKEEEVYYRVTGGATTTADFVSTLTSTPVAPIAGPSSIVEGSVVISTIGQTTVDTDMWLYDSNFNAIVGAANDDESANSGGTGATAQSRFARTLTPGTYYLAISRYNLSNNQPSPNDEDFRTAPLMDFPNAVLCTSTTTTAADLDVSIGGNVVTVLGAAATGLDVQFVQFTVIPNTSPTPPTGVASASPNNIYAADMAPVIIGAPTTAELNVTVTPGNNPPSTGITVSVDASFYGLGTINLLDNGVAPDDTAGDNIFSGTFNAAGATNFGTQNMPVTISDAEARSSSTNVALTLNVPILDAGSIDTNTDGTTAGLFTLGDRPRWIKFNVPALVDDAAGTWFDMFTTNSADTEFGLFDSTGALVDEDDDDGLGLSSLLTYGAGSGADIDGADSATVSDGRDGLTLAAGDYYLAVGRFNVAFSAGFGVSASSNPGFNFFDLTFDTNIVGGPVCDSIDFNGDGLFPDTADIDDFLSVFSGGPCSTGTCGDIDYNNDGLFPDTLDIDSLLSVFSGGPCL
ncbi:MAG TPA: DVUA0089 family protein [Phycisphaerales bacterium]|nr:DVUA0089 family protein [Phycisphaerales bacterium]